MAKVAVKAKADGFRQEISTGVHDFASDAPKEFGGGDSAPNPHELLLGALGSCTAITVQMYAKRKGWDLKGINVEVTEETVEEGGLKQTQISRTIDLQGDLTQEQVDNLKAIADKCPIHKILEAGKKIQTSVSHKA